MKRILLFATIGLLLTACSNSGSKKQSVDNADQKEIVITNDMENALAVIPSWHNEKSVIIMKEPAAHSGEYACETNEQMEYSYSFSELFKNLNKGVPKMAVVSGWVYTTVASPKLGVIVDIKENDVLYDWKVFPLTDILADTGNWVEFKANYYFDKPLNPEQKVSVFLWNQAKKPIYIDDLQITFTY